MVIFFKYFSLENLQKIGGLPVYFQYLKRLLGNNIPASSFILGKAVEQFIKSSVNKELEAKNA